MTQQDIAAVEKLLADSSTPAWVQEALTVTPSEAEVERHIIDQSYLEFLAEQIDLEPRGSDWTRVLRARLDAFKPLVGQPLIRIAIARRDVQFVGHITADDLEVVHTEEF